MTNFPCFCTAKSDNIFGNNIIDDILFPQN